MQYLPEIGHITEIIYDVMREGATLSDVRHGLLRYGIQFIAELETPKTTQINQMGDTFVVPDGHAAIKFDANHDAHV